MNGSQLAAWRDRHKLSAAAAARLLGVSSDTLARWEKRSDELPNYVALACAAFSYGLKPME